MDNVGLNMSDQNQSESVQAALVPKHTSLFEKRLTSSVM